MTSETVISKPSSLQICLRPEFCNIELPSCQAHGRLQTSDPRANLLIQ